jgi:hypothetical protein
LFIRLTKTDGTVLGLDTVDFKKIEGKVEGPSTLTMKCGCVSYTPAGAERPPEVTYEVLETPDFILSKISSIPTSRPSYFSDMRTIAGGPNAT